jgi:hypothetical protein
MKTSKAKALASGSYTFWKETAGATIGMSSSAGPPAASRHACQRVIQMLSVQLWR